MKKNVTEMATIDGGFAGVLRSWFEGIRKKCVIGKKAKLDISLQPKKNGRGFQSGKQTSAADKLTL